MVVSISAREYRDRSRDLRPLLRTLGSMVVSRSQKAFDEQAWNGQRWPARYPSQQTPKVNVAGVVSDLSQGSGIPNRRFQDRPVLEDTGALLASITRSRAAEPTEDSIEVGAGPEVADYAEKHLKGESSVQPITRDVRRGLAEFLDSKKGKPYRERLGFLFGIEELETEPPIRTFIGVTEQLEEDMARTVEIYFATGRT